MKYFKERIEAFFSQFLNIFIFLFQTKKKKKKSCFSLLFLSKNFLFLLFFI